MKWLTAILIALTVFALAACDGSNVSTPGGGASSVVDRTVAAMGGLTAIQAVETQTITASGQRFEPEQTVFPGEPARNVSNFQFTLTREMLNERFRLDWEWDVFYPFTVQLQYADVIDGNTGFVDGRDNPNSPLQAGMPSVRVATMRKLHRMSSPLLLMRRAAENPEIVETRPDEEFLGRLHNVMAVPDVISPIRIFVDAATMLPAKADTLENDPYYGDTLYEVIYEDWRPVGDLFMPFQMTHMLDGRIVHTEVRFLVQNNVPLPADTFGIPADLQVPFDPDDALRGELRSQWFFRLQALGLPNYSDRSLSVVFDEIAPGVFFVTSGSHNNLIVEMEDHLIAVEAPLYEERSQAVIAEAESLVPLKPFRFVVNTHFHHDHGGGIRAYAAEGATVVVGEASAQRFEDIFLEPHTLNPDALELNPQPVVIEPVSPTVPVILSDGTRSVEVYPVESTHSADMVIAYLPQERLVFVSDLFSPSGDFTLADLPPDLVAAFDRFGLVVERIAGGHGVVGSLVAAAP
jgi:glyoxylase-like metal-dependent hydrolase (beta-lactamase superfamily II)